MVNIKTVTIIGTEPVSVYEDFDSYWRDQVAKATEPRKTRLLRLKQHWDWGAVCFAQSVDLPPPCLANVIFLFGSPEKTYIELTKPRIKELLSNPNSIVTLQLKKTAPGKNAIIALVHTREETEIFITQIYLPMDATELFKE